jgi:GTPase
MVLTSSTVSFVLSQKGVVISRRFERTFEVLVEDVFNLKGIGVEVSGFENAGRAIVGQKVCIGPIKGSFITTHVKSAQIVRTNASSVVAGNDACLALALNTDERKLIRKGMEVIFRPAQTSFVFEAEMVILKGSGVDGWSVVVGASILVRRLCEMR